MAIDPKPYLEYLDKEMTIMGILSAFSIAVATVPTEQILNGKSGFLSAIFHAGKSHVMAGCVLAIFAAHLFYLQRSHLAWYYGQIALAQTLGASSEHKIESWLMWADGWDSWIRYQAGFVALSFSMASYFYATIETLVPSLTTISLIWSLYLPLAMAALVMVARWYFFQRFAQADNPFYAWMKTLKRRGS